MRSDVAFQLYLTSLVNSGLEASVNPAVRRRESLLATTAVTSPPASSDVSPETPSATQPQTNSVGLPPSRSQEIAQSVLSGSGATAPLPNPQNASPNTSTLASALSSGAGNQGNPIYVTVADRELVHHLIMGSYHRLTFICSKSNYNHALCSLHCFYCCCEFL